MNLAAYKKTLKIIVTLLLLIYNTTSYAEEDKSQGVDTQIRFVEKLLFDSMSAKQIASSSNPKSKEILQQAKQELQKAKQAHQAGDQAKMEAALQQAKIMLFKAAQLSGNAVVEQKNQDDYSKRLKSVKSLLGAHKNISRTNANKQELAATESHVKQALKTAENDKNNNELEKAQKTIDDAYLTLKISIVKHRDGEQVVRSLSFANKQEEYQYELDRNDTHKMLVNVLLNEKLSANQGLVKLVEMNMKIAEDLKIKAKQQADGGDYENAIKSMDDSTKHIIRAIRSAGVYIPG